ncbi:PD-(D/E)XK nuclease-like domain-containing protein [Vibrio sp. Makdt]|uniref:PD-(D/E)XK nuclease-like domain-containing protein n=1 Tax=Vibrio sp. Makdt TaxID=2998828 RepID=UPI0022CD72D8|nr:PD-(D/E)XK nuclease-like domain-containing protein [Vibrio sp. Makdt]MDA0152421.1 PD-(D/E)XK nuclease-like domain-containing protein [Vibrio sp. Makdt]
MSQVVVDINSIFQETFSSSNGVNKSVNRSPKLTTTCSGFATWGDEPVEAYNGETRAWLDAKGGLVQGIYVNMPDRDYHAIQGCVSSSCLKQFSFDPQGGYDYFTGNVDKKERSPQLVRAMTAGHLIHGHILEPWLSDYGVTTNMTIEELQNKGVKVIEDHDELKKIIADYNLKGGNKKIADKLKLVQAEVDPAYVYYPDYLDSIHSDKDLRSLDRNDYDQAIKAATTFTDSYLFTRNYKRGGYNELTIIVFDKETGLWLKARIDRVDHEYRMLDLKTIHTLTEHQVRRDIEDRLYAIQGAFYHRVATLANFPLKDMFALTFIEWDEQVKFQNAYLSDQSWSKSKKFEDEIYRDFVDWHKSTEQKNSLNYSGEMMVELSFFKLSRRQRVSS